MGFLKACLYFLVGTAVGALIGQLVGGLVSVMLAAILAHTAFQSDTTEVVQQTIAAGKILGVLGGAWLALEYYSHGKEDRAKRAALKTDDDDDGPKAALRQYDGREKG